MLVEVVHEIFLEICKYKNLAQNLYTYLSYLPFILTFHTYLIQHLCIYHFLNSFLNSKYLPFLYLPFSIYPL